MRSSRLLQTALVVASVALASSAYAAGQPTLGPSQTPGPVVTNPGIMKPIFKIQCVVNGTPVEFPNDIYLGNEGPGTIPAGYKVHWDLPAPHFSGDYTFAQDVVPGKGVYILGAVPGGAPAGVLCTWTAVK
jgi:hypothetical protein